MEFFATANVNMDPESIREKITLATLPDYCESFAQVDCLAEDSCEVESIWGRFQVTRQEITGGLRFTMPTCPNCFAWTITSGLPPTPDKVVIHSTFNRQEHEQWFIESMEEFVQQWKAGLEGAAGRSIAPGHGTGSGNIRKLQLSTYTPDND
jgi:hypothetical protein